MGSPDDNCVDVAKKNDAGLTGVGLSPERYQAIFLIIIIAALAIRVAMLVDFVNSNPIARSVGGDAGVYWDTAGQIADGRWIADEPFLSVPLYPHLLAAVRYTGGGLTTAYVVQLIVHLATAGMIGVLAERKFGRITALVAMAIFLGLGEPAFSCNRILPGTIQLFLVTATLLAADRFTRDGRMGNAIQTGALAGLLTLVYPPATLVLLMLGPWMWVRSRQEPGDAEASAAGRAPCFRNGLACGAAAWAAGGLIILPAALHNWAACGEFIPITAHGGITFSHGNTPGADGVYTRVPGVSEFRRTMHRDTARVYARETGHEGSYREIDQFYFAKGLEYLASSPGRALGLIGRKVYWFVTGRHYGDIYFPSLEQRDGWVHLMPLAPIPTAWLVGPTLAGFWIWRRRGGFHGVDGALLVLPLLIVAAFWYSPRYRLPALPIASIATAAALVAAARAAAADGRSWRTLCGVLVLLLASVMTGPLNAAIDFDRPEEYRPRYEYNCGLAYARIGEYEAALAYLTLSDRLAPDQPTVVAAIAGALTELERLTEAEQVSRHLLEIDPGSAVGFRLLGNVHLRRAEWSEAKRAFDQALAIDPEDAEAHLGAWLALSNQDRGEEGVSHLVESTQLDPTCAMAAGEYGIWLAEHDRLTEAAMYLRNAARYAPDQPEAHFNLGEVLLQLGRIGEAAASFQQVLYLNPDHAKAQRKLVNIQAGKVAAPASTVSLYTRIEQAPGEAHLYSELAAMLFVQGRPEEAVATLRRAVERANDRTTVSLELAWLLSTSPVEEIRNGPEAVRLVESVLEQLDDSPPESLDVYAAALAESGRFEEAVREAERAATLATEAGREALAELIGRRIEDYRAHRPYRQE